MRELSWPSSEFGDADWTRVCAAVGLRIYNLLRSGGSVQVWVFSTILCGYRLPLIQRPRLQMDLGLAVVFPDPEYPDYSSLVFSFNACLRPVHADGSLIRLWL